MTRKPQTDRHGEGCPANPGKRPSRIRQDVAIFRTESRSSIKPTKLAARPVDRSRLPKGWMSAGERANALPNNQILE
jgi:hypothetical protein